MLVQIIFCLSFGFSVTLCLFRVINKILLNKNDTTKTQVCNVLVKNSIILNQKLIIHNVIISKNYKYYSSCPNFLVVNAQLVLRINIYTIKIWVYYGPPILCYYISISIYSIKKMVNVIY